MLITMKSPSLVAVATALVLAVFASEVFSAPADMCPSCEKERKAKAPPVCAQEETEFQGSFKNFCEMLRFNCINSRRYYVVTVGKRCDSYEPWAKKHTIDVPIGRKNT